MSLVRRSDAELASLPSESIVETLMTHMLVRAGRRTPSAEAAWWRNSIPVLAQDLVQAGLGQVEVLLEHHLR